MTPRERVTAAVNRQWPDKVPKEANFTPTIAELFKEKTGGEVGPAEYFGYESRGVGFRPLTEQPDFSEYFEGTPEGTRIRGEYGTMQVPGDFYHFTRRVFPMRHLTTVAEVEAYPWPDHTLAYRWEHLPADVERLHDDGWFVSGSVGHIFETAWQLLGMERFLQGFLDEPALVECILDHITENNCLKAQKQAEAGCDMLRYGDDVGMQDRLMMSPAVWREWLKPRLAKEIKAATDVNPDIAVWYHSDGDISLIIEDLIECGVTVLNPVQPECLDVRELKAKYGDRLAFWGTIGTQTIMPFGTPDDVRRTVKEMVELFAPGLVIAPTHVLEPEVPWANIEALFEAVEEYGTF